MFHIFNSIFWVQFYAPDTSVITVLHYYHIVLNFCQIDSVFAGYSVGFCFSKCIFLGVLSVAKYFLGSSEIPNSVDPCLYVYQVHLFEVLGNLGNLREYFSQVCPLRVFHFAPYPKPKTRRLKPLRFCLRHFDQTLRYFDQTPRFSNSKFSILHHTQNGKLGD